MIPHNSWYRSPTAEEKVTASAWSTRDVITRDDISENVTRRPTHRLNSPEVMSQVNEGAFAFTFGPDSGKV